MMVEEAQASWCPPRNSREMVHCGRVSKLPPMATFQLGQTDMMPCRLPGVVWEQDENRVGDEGKPKH